MQASIARPLGLALLVGGCAAFALSLYAMAGRIRAHNADLDAALFRIFEIEDLTFEYADEPATLTPVERDGRPLMEIAWRGETTTVPIGGPVEPRLPGLVGYRDWVRVMLIAQARKADAPDSDALSREDAASLPFEQEPWRLVVAARKPAPGDPQTWGAVNRKAWEYDIVELRTDGGEAPGPLPEPTSTVLNRYGKPNSITPFVEFEPGETFARWRFNMSAMPDLERTWQYAAAIEATPDLLRPTNAFTDDSFTSLSWTWPAAGCSAMAVVAGLVLVGGTLVRRPEDEPPSPGGPKPPDQAGPRA